jgi:hypothetical protein
MVPKIYFVEIIFGIENADFKFVRIDEVVKTKTSDLFNEISYLSQDNFIPNQLSVKKAISLSINGEHADDFIMMK